MINSPGGSSNSVLDETFATDAELVTAVNGKVNTNDSRLTDSRTPTAHKTSHATGGSDALTASDVGADAAGAATSAVGTHAGITGAASSGAAAHQSSGIWVATNGDLSRIMESGNANLDDLLEYIDGRAAKISETIAKATLDANTVLYATTDDTPAALTVGASTVVGRKATGDIVALTASELRTVAGLGTAATVDTGTGSTNAILGNDSRLTDARTPTTHNHAGSEITSGTVDTARLGSGSASASTYLRGDQTWAAVSSGADATALHVGAKLSAKFYQWHGGYASYGDSGNANNVLTDRTLYACKWTPEPGGWTDICYTVTTSGTYSGDMLMEWWTIGSDGQPGTFIQGIRKTTTATNAGVDVTASIGSTWTITDFVECYLFFGVYKTTGTNMGISSINGVATTHGSLPYSSGFIAVTNRNTTLSKATTVPSSGFLTATPDITTFAEAGRIVPALAGKAA